MGVLDYVLNRCTLRELDALEAAVERRRRDLSAQTGIISLDPARAAREMSGAVQNSINQSMDSIRHTFRDFAADTIRKEAPELTEEQLSELVDAWIPRDMSVDRSGRVASSSGIPRQGDAAPNGDGRSLGGRGQGAGAGQYVGLAQRGRINGLPPEAMRSMVLQFIAYSTGSMSVSEEAGLRDEVGDWSAIYWKRFPREVQAAIREFLAGNLSEGEFGETLDALLR